MELAMFKLTFFFPIFFIIHSCYLYRIIFKTSRSYVFCMSRCWVIKLLIRHDPSKTYRWQSKRGVESVRVEQSRPDPTLSIFCPILSCACHVLSCPVLFSPDLPYPIPLCPFLSCLWNWHTVDINTFVHILHY